MILAINYTPYTFLIADITACAFILVSLASAIGIESKTTPAPA